MKYFNISEYFQTFPIFSRDEKKEPEKELTWQELEAAQRAM